jgi:hypothetical protein
MIIKPKNLAELEVCFDKFSNGYLFRGQVKNFTDDNGEVNIPTSFSRHGCIPHIMLKWSHYSRAMIRAFSEVDYFDIDLELSQAILQHYGWRSFYVDLTKSPQVACWFASNAYNESKSIHRSEDVNENPVRLVHKNSNYSETNCSGHIYVIDKLALNTLGIEVHDLTDLQGDEGKLRFNAQQACLVGNLHDNLPPQVIAAHIEVPADILREFYKKNNIDNVSDVFPSKRDDFILNFLLSLPWEKMNIDNVIPTFRRGLDIPDYEENFVKRLPPEITLYEGFWIADQLEYLDGKFKNAPFYKLPQTSYYSNTNKPFDLTYVNQVLEEQGEFFIEMDGLIKIVEVSEAEFYEKGIYVSICKSGLISVSALTINHPSNVIAEFGIDIGWFYENKEGSWSKVTHTEQCPCNNTLRHELHFSLLNMLNEALKYNELSKESSLCYRHKNVHSA